jgi:hypothetical protein
MSIFGCAYQPFIFFAFQWYNCIQMLKIVVCVTRIFSILYVSLRRELFEDFMSYTNKYLQTENKIPQKLRNFSLVESFESCLLFIQFIPQIFLEFLN